MSTREWELRWEHEETSDQYLELVSTVADEALPLVVPTAEDFRLSLAADVVLFIVCDSVMRALMSDLLDAANPEPVGVRPDLT